ncbi:MAG: segregation and condensation protein A [Alphaproteobacteria bacterium]
MTDILEFELDPPRDDRKLVVDLGHYEGPVDLLLQLARDQKVDLLQISILALAEQYLAFIEAAKDLELEIAADYLVMAAWLAYLKSRLLLPKDNAPPEDEPSPEALAAALARRLKRLEGLQDAARLLMALPQRGIDRFGRGMSENLPEEITTVASTDITELLQAYAGVQRRHSNKTLTIRTSRLHTVEAAIRRLSNMLGVAIEWRAIERFLPLVTGDPILQQSAFASTFAASLQLAKDGEISIRQDSPFGSIYLKARQGRATDEVDENGLYDRDD